MNSRTPDDITTLRPSGASPVSVTRPPAHPVRRAALVLFVGIGAFWPSLAPVATAAAEDLRSPALVPLPLGSVRPAGWLREQLVIQAGGLTGHLDEFWPDVARSGWIGGDAEGWERMPYWLDGALPLAYLLGDRGLKAKVDRYIDHILEHQQEDGWLGPVKSGRGNYKARDPWPVFVMLKVLTQYEEVTGDERVVPAITRFLRLLDRQLAERPLFDWNRMRWQDGALTVHWLHDRTKEPWLLALARRLHDQGYDWRRHFEKLPFEEKAARWEHESHVVNNAMGIKAPGVWFRQGGDPADRAAVHSGLEQLDRFHGQAGGVFSGDECFAGRMPSQGTETCAVVEYLFSLEVLMSLLGDAALGDRIERVAFNALPAPLKSDMWARQYVQQANQPVARRSEVRVYTTNNEWANVYGLETHYGCCTANLHQGWPKLVEHLWMATPDGGLAAVVWAPAVVTTRVREVPVTVRVRTDYPFGETVTVRVTPERPLRFPLRLRVPAWADAATMPVSRGATKVLPMEPGAWCVLNREWSPGGDPVELRFPMRVRHERRFRGAATLLRGPLVYSLAVGEHWKQARGERPHADWEVFPTTAWNYAIQLDGSHPDLGGVPVVGPLDGNPFDPDRAPVRLLVRGRRLPEWTLERSTAAPPPASPVESDQPLETLSLIPYGAAKLRITEFPVLRR